MQPPDFQDRWISELSLEELKALKYEREFWARPCQLPPAWDWFFWFFLGGRGTGKTWTGTQQVLEWYREGHERINLAARTSGDIRKTMLYGVSGIITLAPKHERPKYITSLKELHWPDGRVSLCFSADEPEQGRGPASDKLWADELGAWPDDELWHNLVMGLREGNCPQALITTTGRRKALLRELFKDPATAVTRGHTYDNAQNLGARYLAYMQQRYEGTALGDQELKGDILTEYEGAFWTQELLDRTARETHPRLTRVVIGVDPAVTKTKRSDRIGIIVAGLGVDGHGYVLKDLSMKGSPPEWARRVLWAYKHFGASLIKAERNRGGDLIEYVLKIAGEEADETPVIETFNSQEEKAIKAEPCATLYERGLVHHVRRTDISGADQPEWSTLESEQTDWDPAMSSYSPNAIDALCFAVLELFPQMEPQIEPYQIEPKTGLYLPASAQRKSWSKSSPTPASPYLAERRSMWQ